MSKVIATALAVLVGLASANPAFAGERKSKSEKNLCPDIPTTNDIERTREGGASLQIAGFGVSGNKSRANSVKDVMMREGGPEAWTAAAIFSKRCHDLQKRYPHDPERQVQELLILRERLLTPIPEQLPEPSPNLATEVSKAPNWQPSAGSQTAIETPVTDTVEKLNASDENETQAKPMQAPRRSYAMTVSTFPCAGNACTQSNESISTTSCTTAPPTIIRSPSIMVGNMIIGGIETTIAGSTSCMTTFGF